MKDITLKAYKMHLFWESNKRTKYIAFILKQKMPHLWQTTTQSHKSKMEEVKTHLDVYLFHFHGQLSKCDLHQPYLSSKHFFCLQILRSNSLEAWGKWSKHKLKIPHRKLIILDPVSFITIGLPEIIWDTSTYLDATLKEVTCMVHVLYSG